MLKTANTDFATEGIYETGLTGKTAPIADSTRGLERIVAAGKSMEDSQVKAGAQ